MSTPTLLPAAPRRTDDGRLRSYSALLAASAAAGLPAAPPGAAPGSPAASGPPAWEAPAVEGRTATYGELMAALDAAGQDAANRKSRLRLWMEHLGYAEDTPVGPELGAAFDDALFAFKAYLDRRGDSARGVGESASRMRAVQRVAADLVVLAVHGATFTEVLAAAVDHSPLPNAEVARRAGMSVHTLRAWLGRRMQPTSRSAGVLPALERVLGLPAGALLDRLPVSPASRDWTTTAFGRALCAAAEDAGMTVSRAANAAGVPPHVVYGWVYGEDQPGVVQRARDVPALERALGIAPDALAAHLPPLSLRSLPYLADLTAAQQAEVDALVRHKTDILEDREDHRPNRYWRVRRDDGVCAAGDRFTTTLRSLYGHAALPADADNPLMRGLGLPEGSGSLADLTDAERVIGYLKFRAARSRYGAQLRRQRLEGRDAGPAPDEEPVSGYNGDTRLMLETVCSLLRPQTGFLWQANDPAVAAFPAAADPGALAAWRARCEASGRRLREFLKHLDKQEQIQPTRGHAHIARILEMDRPMDALAMLRDRARQSYEDARRFYRDPVRVAVRLRDFILIALLCSAPLRKRHWEILSYREDGTGSLRLVSDPASPHAGHYEVVFPKSAFKALAEFRKADYRAQVPQWLTPFIRAYLAEARPLLRDAARSDYVFRSSPSIGARARAKAAAARPRPSSIEQMIVGATRRLLPDLAPEGMRTHAFRHVIATHLVKCYPVDGLERAADALHNTIAVVRKHYGHLSGLDRTTRSMRILDEEYRHAAPERPSRKAAG